MGEEEALLWKDAMQDLKSFLRWGKTRKGWIGFELNAFRQIDKHPVAPQREVKS